MPAVPLHLFDDYASSQLQLLKAWESSASYVTESYSEQLKANSTQTINGIEYKVRLEASPLEFGRMSNYAEKKKSVVSSKGYILLFEQGYFQSNFDLKYLDYYASMPSTCRNEKHTKEKYPFLIIGLQGHNQKETTTEKEVAEWANKHLESWEYIKIDIWSLKDAAERKAFLKGIDAQNEYNNKLSKEPKELKPEEDRLTKLSDEEFKQLQEEQKQKLQQAMNNLIVKADQIILPEVEEETEVTAKPTNSRLFTFFSKKKQSQTENSSVSTNQVQASENPSTQTSTTGKKASSFTKFLQALLLKN
eukprot:TRINITY_DN2042_c0_g1_i3.p1 TRINITY_DN2042_c0_g1~~TRINITY_DN2042_c0_g1_i3.p1  ORF type:complete len:305 (-),score=98.17 TRINITY_DN2042_c0_g1_i3:185-1099(-)